MRTRLAALMFLEYAVQGLWVVPLAPFLMGSPHEGGLNMPAGHVALLYATFAIGATLSPLIVGLVADRLFPLQRVLAVLHLVGAGLLAAALWWSATAAQDVRDIFLNLAEEVPLRSEAISGSLRGTLVWNEALDSPSSLTCRISR